MGANFVFSDGLEDPHVVVSSRQIRSAQFLDVIKGVCGPFGLDIISLASLNLWEQMVANPFHHVLSMFPHQHQLGGLDLISELAQIEVSRAR